jgi:hypothetical protein
MIDGSVAAKLRQIETQLQQHGSRRISESPDAFLTVPASERRFD